MLTKNKKNRMVQELKNYKKHYLDKQFSDLDESATRLMVNHFLTEVLGYKMIEEIKTEYMIRGTYADYVIQIGGKRHFLIEVKAMSLELSEKHLRQAINYGANEGIDWAVLTNGKRMDLYRILFDKPISCKKIFSLDLSDSDALKANVVSLEFLHRECIIKGELETLWKKFSALDPIVISNLLFGRPVLNYLKRELNKKFKSRFKDEDVIGGIKNVISEAICIADIKPVKTQRKKEHKDEAVSSPIPIEPLVNQSSPL